LDEDGILQGNLTISINSKSNNFEGMKDGEFQIQSGKYRLDPGFNKIRIVFLKENTEGNKVLHFTFHQGILVNHTDLSTECKPCPTGQYSKEG